MQDCHSHNLYRHCYNTRIIYIQKATSYSVKIILCKFHSSCPTEVLIETQPSITEVLISFLWKLFVVSNEKIDKWGVVISLSKLSERWMPCVLDDILVGFSEVYIDSKLVYYFHLGRKWSRSFQLVLSVGKHLSLKIFKELVELVGSVYELFDSYKSIFRLFEMRWDINFRIINEFCAEEIPKILFCCVGTHEGLMKFDLNQWIYSKLPKGRM